ncbi:MAG: DUF92 domain-containing protein [Anaerolineales bacterium]
MLEISAGYSALRLLSGLGLGALFSGIAWYLRALTASGVLAATVLGGLIFGFAGLPWAILLVVFFASSSALSRLFENRKRSVMETFAKGGRRDLAQVAANGAVPALIVFGLALELISIPAAWMAFAAALATVNADTWATELGVLSPSNPRLVNTGRKVPRGTSGGISLLGSLAALGGALLIALLAGLFLKPPNLIIAVSALTIIGLVGSYVDSLLGATVQAIYYCPSCKKETERFPEHTCGTKTVHRRGWRWLTNDWVNFLSALFSAFLAVGLFIAMGMG